MIQNELKNVTHIWYFAVAFPNDDDQSVGDVDNTEQRFDDGWVDEPVLNERRHFVVLLSTSTLQKLVQFNCFYAQNKLECLPVEIISSNTD